MAKSTNSPSYEPDRRKFLFASLAAIIGADPLSKAALASAKRAEIISAFSKVFARLMVEAPEIIVKPWLYEFWQQGKVPGVIEGAFRELGFVREGEPITHAVWKRVIRECTTVEKPKGILQQTLEEMERQEVLGRIALLIRSPGERLSQMLCKQNNHPAASNEGN